jgi:hypothetical protein
MPVRVKKTRQIKNDSAIDSIKKLTRLSLRTQRTRLREIEPEDRSGFIFKSHLRCDADSALTSKGEPAFD